MGCVQHTYTLVRQRRPTNRCDGRAFILDYSQDEVLQAERFDFLRLRLYDEILQMIQLGFEYGKRIDEQGLLDMHLASIRRTPL